MRSFKWYKSIPVGHNDDDDDDIVGCHRCVRLDLTCHPQVTSGVSKRLKLYKTRTQLKQEREEALASWTPASSVGDYIARLNLHLASNTIACNGGLDDTRATTTTATPTSTIPRHPVIHELQGYMASAQMAYKIIMDLKDEGKVHLGALKHML